MCWLLLPWHRDPLQWRAACALKYMRGAVPVFPKVPPPKWDLQKQIRSSDLNLACPQKENALRQTAGSAQVCPDNKGNQRCSAWAVTRPASSWLKLGQLKHNMLDVSLLTEQQEAINNVFRCVTVAELCVDPRALDEASRTHAHRHFPEAGWWLWLCVHRLCITCSSAFIFLQRHILLPLPKPPTRALSPKVEQVWMKWEPLKAWS